MPDTPIAPSAAPCPPPHTEASPSVVVFDIGGVLIDWDPRYLYRKLFDGDDAAMERFLTTICTPEWNVLQDAGRPWADAVAQLSALYPEQAELIAAYDLRWSEMVPSAIPGTADLLDALKARGVPVYAITNFSAEKFPLAQSRFPELTRFDGVIVSGREKIIKPAPEIYHLLCRRYGLRAADCLFIDDVEKNVAAAQAVGMSAVRFTDAAALAETLRHYHLL